MTRALLFLAAGASALGDLDLLFTEFKSKFNKSYSSASEELKRFKIFASNMEVAAKMAELEGEVQQLQLLQ